MTAQRPQSFRVGYVRALVLPRDRPAAAAAAAAAGAAPDECVQIRYAYIIMYFLPLIT